MGWAMSAGRKHGQRHLVEQRLKGVVIAAVDYGDVDRQVREPFGRVKAGKASADDDHAGAASRRCIAIGSGFVLDLLHRFAHAAASTADACLSVLLNKRCARPRESDSD